MTSHLPVELEICRWVNTAAKLSWVETGGDGGVSLARGVFVMAARPQRRVAESQPVACRLLQQSSLQTRKAIPFSGASSSNAQSQAASIRCQSYAKRSIERPMPTSSRPCLHSTPPTQSAPPHLVLRRTHMRLLLALSFTRCLSNPGEFMQILSSPAAAASLPPLVHFHFVSLASCRFTTSLHPHPSS